jgi:CoA-transferase family III
MSETELVGQLSAVLESTGLRIEDTGGTVTFLGEDPILPSVHRLGAMSALTLMANAVAAAALWRERSGHSQDLSVDLREAVYAIGGTDFGVGAFRSTLNGYPFVDDRDSPHPIRARTEFHQLNDGRWCSLNAHYRHMLFDWLSLLKCDPYPEAVVAAVGTWTSEALEEAAVQRGLAFSRVMSRDEWARHEQGRAQAATPLIDVRKIGTSPAEPLDPGSRPLSGVRVLGVTHAIAGAIVGRTLAEQGADVLNLHSPNQVEHDTVYNSANVGSRSALVDLKSAEGREVARRLLATADVFVENQRSGAMDRLGLSDEELMEIRPGIIVVSVRCFGEAGPWRTRPGNDRQGTAAAGVAVSEGSEERPCLPPPQTTNDYMTGYQGAAGATAALLRRAREGGSYRVNVSLVRSAMMLGALGLLDRDEAIAPGWERRLVKAPALTASTPMGELHRVAPVVRFSRTPPSWTAPILVPRGSSRAEWLG